MAGESLAPRRLNGEKHMQLSKEAELDKSDDVEILWETGPPQRDSEQNSAQARYCFA